MLKSRNTVEHMQAKSMEKIDAKQNETIFLKKLIVQFYSKILYFDRKTKIPRQFSLTVQ